MEALKRILIITTLALPQFAMSAELIIGGWSYHHSKSFTRDGEDIKYLNQNKLIALDFNNVVLASFTNSYRHKTKAVGYSYNFNKYFGVMPLLTDTYENQTPLKLGRVNLMGMLTLKAGPAILLFLPGMAYTLAFRFEL